MCAVAGGEIWNGAQGQRGQRAAACSASAGGPAGTGDRVCCAPLPLVFTNSIQGRRPGQQHSALSGKTVPLGARRRRHGGVKGKSGRALARRHRPSSIVAPLVFRKPAQVPQAPAPLWDDVFSESPPTRPCVQWQGGRGGTGQGASGYSEQQLAVPAPVALWARATVRALRRFH